MKHTDPPQSLSEIIGQKNIKENLSIQIIAAKTRGDFLEHLLFYGPYGSGKSTLAKVVANDMGVNFKSIDGSTLAKPMDIANTITNLYAGDILIVEQIEKLRKKILEILYPALEDFVLDVVIGKGLSARYARLKLPKFTLIGTTSKLSAVDERLKKFMFLYNLEPYDNNDLSRMIIFFAKQNAITIDIDAVSILAKYSKGLPAEASNLLRHAHNYAIARADGVITLNVAKKALNLRIDYRDEK